MSGRCGGALRRCVILASFVFGLASGVPGQAVVRVPEDFSSLAEALTNLPPDGGIVEISTDVQSEELVMSGRFIELRGAPGMEPPTVTFEWSDGIHDAISVDGGSLTLRELELRSAAPEFLFYFVRAVNAEVLLADVTITADGNIEEGAAHISSAPRAWIQRCSIGSTVTFENCDDVLIASSTIRGRNGESPVFTPVEGVRYAQSAVVVESSPFVRFYKAELSAGMAPGTQPLDLSLNGSEACWRDSDFTVDQRGGPPLSRCSMFVPDFTNDVSAAIREMDQGDTALEVTRDFSGPPIQGNQDVLIRPFGGASHKISIMRSSPTEASINWTGGYLKVQDLELKLESSESTPTLSFQNCSFELRNLRLDLSGSSGLPLLSAIGCDATSVWASRLHREGSLHFENTRLVRLIHQSSDYAEAETPIDLAVKDAELVWMEGLAFPDGSSVAFVNVDRVEMHDVSIFTGGMPFAFTDVREARLVNSTVQSPGEVAITAARTRVCTPGSLVSSGGASGAAAIVLLEDSTLNDCLPVVLVPREATDLATAASKAGSPGRILVTRAVGVPRVHFEGVDIIIEGAPAWGDEAVLTLSQPPMPGPFISITNGGLHIDRVRIPFSSTHFSVVKAVESRLVISRMIQDIGQNFLGINSGPPSFFIEALDCPSVEITNCELPATGRIRVVGCNELLLSSVSLEGLYGNPYPCIFVVATSDGLPVLDISAVALTSIRGSTIRGGSVWNQPGSPCEPLPELLPAPAILAEETILCIENSTIEGGVDSYPTDPAAPPIMAGEGVQIGCPGSSMHLY